MQRRASNPSLVATERLVAGYGYGRYDMRHNRRAALKISDTERAEDLLRGAVGKRLTYRRIGEAANA